MQVRFINMFGDGTVKSLEVEEGTTLDSFLANHIRDVDGAVVRVNRQEVEDPSGYELGPEDRVSATPSKMAGATRPS